jgi:hypothetical protein
MDAAINVVINHHCVIPIHYSTQANLLYTDFNNKTNGLWMQDFPVKQGVASGRCDPAAPPADTSMPRHMAAGRAAPHTPAAAASSPMPPSSAPTSTGTEPTSPFETDLIQYLEVAMPQRTVAVPKPQPADARPPMMLLTPATLSRCGGCNVIFQLDVLARKMVLIAVG